MKESLSRKQLGSSSKKTLRPSQYEDPNSKEKPPSREPETPNELRKGRSMTKLAKIERN